MGGVTGRRKLIPCALLAFTAIYVALVYLPFHRHLWFDELLTYYIAQSRNFELARKWDLSPPLMHVLAHVSLVWNHGAPIAVRWPSVISFYFGSLALFGYAARKLGVGFGALLLLVLWYSPSFPYATEARPYALLYGAFCCLLFFWDLALTRRRKLPLIGVTVSALLLVNAHVLAPLSFLPFAAAELVRWRERRLPDFPLWTALFLPLICVLGYLPLIHSYKDIGHYPPAFQASPRVLASYYWHTFTGVVLCLVVAAIAAALSSWPTVKHVGQTLGRNRRLTPAGALFLVLAAVPVALDAIMMRDHAPFWGRYAITSAIGLYGIAVYLLAASFRFHRRAGMAAAAAAAVLLVAQKIALPIYRNAAHPAPTNVNALASIYPDQPIVAASGLTFVEMSKYENPSILARLYYLRDRAAALRYANATMFEDMNGYQAAFHFPGTVESYPAFIAQHRRFLVFGTIGYPEDWLLRKLIADGAKVRPLCSFESPYKDKDLYEVELAGSAH